MATWPATLPTFQEILKDSYNESMPNNILRTEMDIGPPNVRMRTTSGPIPFSGTMYLTTAQAALFYTFYTSTISYGAVQFDTVHPRTGAAITVYFVGQPTLSKTMGVGWALSFTAEILP